MERPTAEQMRLLREQLPLDRLLQSVESRFYHDNLLGDQRFEYQGEDKAIIPDPLSRHTTVDILGEVARRIPTLDAGDLQTMTAGLSKIFFEQPDLVGPLYLPWIFTFGQVIGARQAALASQA